MHRLLWALLLALPLQVLLARPLVARAASHTFSVNSNEWFSDLAPGDGICRTGNNTCTLRAAIEEAYALGVASSGADTITINLEYNSYPLQSTLNPGNATVIINGNGSTLTGSFGGAVANYRLLQNSGLTGHWVLNNLTMTGSTGGGIRVLPSGSLTIVNCTFEGLGALTTAGTTSGGAIITGTSVALTAMGSTFANNNATDNGGAIAHGHGPLTISSSMFSGNTSTSGDGGGLYAVSSSGSEASLTNVSFHNNAAVRGGGLFAQSLVLKMTGGEVSGNVAVEGGGIALDYTKVGTLLSEVRIVENTASQEGGGLVVYRDALGTWLLKSTVQGNSAQRGGGIMVHGARLDVEQSAVVRNVALGTADTDGGGGIRVVKGTTTPLPLSVINSTITGNVAHRHGGGLFLGGDTSAYLSSATVTENVANEARSARGAGGGLVLFSGATASLGNTILAGNIMRMPDPPPLVVIATPDVDGSLVSRGYNLIGAANPLTTITGDTTGNLVGTIHAPIDPGLSYISSGCSHAYISSVPMHLLLPTSVAINGANPAGVRHTRPSEDRLLTVDQCGSPRVQQGRADMGAYESPHAKLWPYKRYVPIAMR